MDPEEENPEGSGGSYDPGDSRPTGVVDPAEPEGSGSLNGYQVGSNLGDPMGADETWSCPWELVVTSSGTIYYYCPYSTNPQTGLPIAQWVEAPEQAAGSGPALTATK